MVLAIAAMGLLSLVVMSLWNWLVPSLFRGPALQYWQAVGLLLLSRILFGSLRGRGGWHGHWRARMWRERWANMTPQERERFRERFQHRCGQRVVPAQGTTAPPT